MDGTFKLTLESPLTVSSTKRPGSFDSTVTQSISFTLSEIFPLQPLLNNSQLSGLCPIEERLGGGGSTEEEEEEEEEEDI